jgi:hypothetical protein
MYSGKIAVPPGGGGIVNTVLANTNIKTLLTQYRLPYKNVDQNIQLIYLQTEYILFFYN